MNLNGFERKVTLLINNNNPELQIQYILDGEEVTIISCAGFGSTVIIPDEIKGFQVTKIGSYAFSDPDSAIKSVDVKEKLYKEIIPGFSPLGSKEGFIFGRKLKEIGLPRYIKTIDAYAFYNCRELNKISLPANKITIENGAFMNCEKLASIHVEALPDDITSVRSFLADLNSEVCVTFTCNDTEAAFIFPEYFEYAEENTPARVFQYFLYGAGYRYRQCFEQGKLNIYAYDTVFQSAEIQTIQDTALRIAFVRLNAPYKLNLSAKEAYLSYIALHIDKALEIMLKKDDMKGLNFFNWA